MLCFCTHHLIILNKAIIFIDQGCDMIFIKFEACQNKARAKTIHKISGNEKLLWIKIIK